jgi:group II intron reverse transcriptase/maturase
MAGTLIPSTVSTKQQRIAQLAREDPGRALHSLSHHLDLDWLIEAFRRTRKDGATGIDGQTGVEYAVNLEANLLDLLNRAKSGDNYKAPPVRRVNIPKGDGTSRPLGIPTFEDKVLQRAVVMVLEPIYEQDFLDCSFGFRPGRSAHQALESIRSELMEMGGGWVLDVDIKQYFNSLDHAHLRNILAKRMRDGVITRLVGKWLNAGVWEKGAVTHPGVGSPQGGVISPVLSNVYLHEVLDVWFEKEVKPRLTGTAFLVRYADDFVMGFSREVDARRVLDVLPKRFGKYGLALHPEKTRLLDFRRPRNRKDSNDGEGPGSFDFLGFTHYWGMSKKGYRVVMRKTAGKRVTRALHRIKEWCRLNRHRPIREQWEALGKQLKGHYAYYGITGNYRCLKKFRFEVSRLWRKWLSRRSNKASLDWEVFNRLLDRYPLPPAKVVHTVYQLAANP